MHFYVEIIFFMKKFIIKEYFFLNIYINNNNILKNYKKLYFTFTSAKYIYVC